MLFILTALLAAGAQISDADQKAMHDYQLTPAKIDKLMAVGEKMKAWSKAHPESKQQGDLMQGKTLDESIKSIEAKPEFVAMLKSQGVTPRDFVLGTMSLFTAAMWAQMSQQYPDAKMPAEINARNVKLLRENPEVMQKWQAAWSEEAARKHGQPDAAPQGQ